jgi:polyisoprenoid-binding protein YceI
MSRRGTLVALVAAVVAVGLVGAVATYLFFFSNSAPSAATIDQAAGAIASSAAISSPGNTSESLDGIWNVNTTIGSFSDYSSSWAGFRVNEVLSNIGDSTAIGRTPGVSGQLVFSGQTLSSATVYADLTTITSDQPRRDPSIQRTLETARFPTATFSLTQPVTLPEVPREGATYTAAAPGKMTIHGVTNDVSVALQAQLKNGVVVIVGSTPFAFADYDMSAPRAPVVLSVEDSGTIEFQLFFSR